MTIIKVRKKTRIYFVAFSLITFIAGFLVGRESQKSKIIELEQSAKMIGWWNQQLENELDSLVIKYNEEPK